VIVSEKKITVKTAKGLSWVAQETNKGKSSNYNGFLGYTIELAGDIDLDNYEWTPIGTSDNPFRGSFNGNGYKISNMKIGSQDVVLDKKFIGFFGYIKKDLIGEEIKIENVTLKGGQIYGEENTQYVGALAGYVYAYGYDAKAHITISHCSSSVEVTGGMAFLSYTGGIIGMGEGKGEVTGSLIIEYCTNSGTIKGGGTSYSYTGGIIGFGKGIGEGSGKGDGSLVIKNCTNSGEIVGTGNSSSCTGGIIGYGSASGEGDSSLSIKNCTNNGEIKGGDTSSTTTGGIIGYGYGYGDGIYGNGSLNIENCTNKGKITGEVTSNSSTGGIIGEGSGRGFANGTGSITIKYCTNSEEIKGMGTSYSYTGGIIGYGYGEDGGFLEISDCYSYCNIKALVGFAGGVAGWLQCRTTNTKVYITSSYATGMITKSGGYVGGVVGGLLKIDDNYPTVSNCLVVMEPFEESATHTHRIVGAVGTTSNNVSFATNDTSFENYFGDKDRANIGIVAKGSNPENTEDSWKTLEGETWNGEKSILLSKFNDSSWSIDASGKYLPQLKTKDGIEHPLVSFVSGQGFP